jgi:hypothetical protein
MREIPHISGTTARCFLPYTKKASPTELVSMIHKSDEVVNSITYGY